MVQLLVLSGKKAGTKFNALRLPVHVGRADDADLPLDDPGVWPRHFQIIWQAPDLVVRAEDNALVQVNNNTVQQAPLHNGDIISIGGASLRFALGPMTQTSLAPSEIMTWIGIAILCLAQVIAITQLPR